MRLFVEVCAFVAFVSGSTTRLAFRVTKVLGRGTGFNSGWEIPSLLNPVDTLLVFEECGSARCNLTAGAGGW